MPEIRIDVSQLAAPAVSVPEVNSPLIDGSALPPHRLALPAHKGYHLKLSSGAVANLEFDVTPSGTIDFDTTCDGFLSGRGSDTLVVKGCPITINGTKLSHDLLMPIPGIPPLRHNQQNPLQLLPASGYLFEAGSGAVANWKFDVTPSGT
ncbi:Ig-like domain repeat protein, partial [Streptomyces olivochromogenes]